SRPAAAARRRRGGCGAHDPARERTRALPALTFMAVRNSGTRFKHRTWFGSNSTARRCDDRSSAVSANQVREFRTAPRLLFREEDFAARLAGDRLRDVGPEEPAEGGVVVLADHDRGRVPLLGDPEDLPGRVAQRPLDRPLDFALADTTPRLFEQRLQLDRPLRRDRR